MEQHQERAYPDDVIIYRHGRFIAWKTRAKRPWIYTQNPDDFHKTLSAEWGPYSWAYVSAVMLLARDYGTSLGPTVRPEDVVVGNALGERGEELNLDEVFQTFTMSGLPADLQVQYDTIEMTTEGAARFHAHARKRTLAEMYNYKRRMTRRGFPFN